MNTKTSEDYCCVLDILFQQNHDFAMLIPKSCAIRAAFKKTIILPDKKTITKMSKMSSSDLKETLFQFILREPKGSSISSIIEKGSGIIEAFNRSYYYDVTKNSKNEIMFNGSLVTVTQLPDKYEKIIHAIKPIVPKQKKDIKSTSGSPIQSSLVKTLSKKGGCLGGSSCKKGGSVACCPWGGSGKKGAINRLKKKSLYPTTSRITF